MSKKVNKACRNPAEESESDYASDTSSEEQKSSQDVSKHLDTKLLSKRKRGNIDEGKYWCPECKCKDFRPANLSDTSKKSQRTFQCLAKLYSKGLGQLLLSNEFIET
jgi:hypothetical protein